MAVQRYCSLGSLKKARWMSFLTAVSFTVASSMACFIGLVLVKYYAGCDPVNLKLAKPDQLVMRMMLETLGNIPCLPGVFLACLCSGTLSTVSSTINSMAAVLWDDFLRGPLETKVKLDTALVLISVVCGLLATFASFACGPMGGLIKAVTSIMGALYGPILGLFFCGVFFKRMKSEKAAVVGILLSTGVLLWISIGYVTLKPYSSFRIPLENISIQNCPFVIGGTNLSNFSTEIALNYGIKAYGPISGDQTVSWPYRISMFLYPAIGVALVVILTSFLSCLSPNNCKSPGLQTVDQKQSVEKHLLADNQSTELETRLTT